MSPPLPPNGPSKTALTLGNVGLISPNGSNSLNAVASVINAGKIIISPYDHGETHQSLTRAAPDKITSTPEAACRSEEERWCEDIQPDCILETTAEVTSTQSIASVFSPHLDNHQRVYLLAGGKPATATAATAAPVILEFKPINQQWVVSKEIPVLDAAVRGRLAAVCMPGKTPETYLFYTTAHGTIQDLVWSPLDAEWQPGELFKTGRHPKISPRSSLSVLRSAYYIKLYYQRGAEVVELSYSLFTRSWTFAKICDADIGTPVAVTSWADQQCTVYNVYVLIDGKPSLWRADCEGLKRIWLDPPPTFPIHCTSLSAISWFNQATKRANVKIYYMSDTGHVCEWAWNSKKRWDSHEVVKALPLALDQGCSTGVQITALQMYDGERIRVYYAICGELQQVAFSHRIKTGKIKSICRA